MLWCWWWVLFALHVSFTCWVFFAKTYVTKVYFWLHHSRLLFMVLINTNQIKKCTVRHTLLLPSHEFTSLKSFLTNHALQDHGLHPSVKHGHQPNLLHLNQTTLPTQRQPPPHHRRTPPNPPNGQQLKHDRLVTRLLFRLARRL